MRLKSYNENTLYMLYRQSHKLSELVIPIYLKNMWFFCTYINYNAVFHYVNLVGIIYIFCEGS